MTVGLILWGHALAALLFGAAALAAWRNPAGGWPRTPFVAALLLTALWALAVAGIDARDVSTALAEAVRNLAWLWLVAGLRSRIGRGDGAVGALTIVVAAVTVAAGIGAIVPLGEAGVVLHAVALLGALILLNQLAASAGGRGDVRLAAAALGVMWALDLAMTGVVLAQGVWSAPLAAIRGGMMLVVAVLVAAAARRGGGGAPALSRTVAWRVVAVAAVSLYVGGIALAANWAAAAFGANGRLAQTAIVFGATAALLTLVSTPWLRAWARVKIAKHLFRHRYDYRIEWQRFTATLGSPACASDPLGVRVVRAVANLTDSPAGLLLVVDEATLGVAAEWNWPNRPEIVDTGLARYLAESGRIVALDPVRSGAAPAEEVAAVPPALGDDPRAWVVVPLMHGDALAGAIVLARPPVDRLLDWEDLDLLRVVGRQAASYLAEDRAHIALADAARFDEFNRRFAFLLHDIKNVASQMTLVARNAERHAENPEFRADMIATLRDGADRMATLLTRLGGQGATRPEPAQPVDLAALAGRVAAGQRAQSNVLVETANHPLAHAQPARLEKLLSHLVQNAVESGPGVPVRILVRQDGGAAVVEVVDCGAGMAPAFVRDQLFRPFASTKPGGFGIGAYEARQLVREMGGDIAVESRPGEGSRFRVTLPLAAPLEAAA